MNTMPRLADKIKDMKARFRYGIMKDLTPHAMVLMPVRLPNCSAPNPDGNVQTNTIKFSNRFNS